MENIVNVSQSASGEFKPASSCYDNTTDCALRWL